METNPDASKESTPPPYTARPRRPLPVPGSPVPPSSFYAEPKTKSSEAPPLPKRPDGIGSSSTVMSYVPEIVAERVVDEDGDEIPPLAAPTPVATTTGTGNRWGNQSGSTSYEGSVNAWGDTPAVWGDASVSAWNSHPDPTESFFSQYHSEDQLESIASSLPISGRSPSDELQFWDYESILRKGFPGPGFLAPVLNDRISNRLGDGELFSVSVGKVNLTPGPSKDDPPPAPTSEHPKISKSSPPKFHPFHVPPSLDEIRLAIPHPNAFYSPKQNRWLFLSWKSSSVPPPFAASFSTPNPLYDGFAGYGYMTPSWKYALPDQENRKKVVNCLDDDDPIDSTIMGKKKNKTHHYHYYPNAVDASRLDVPFPMRRASYPKSKRKTKKAEGENPDTVMEGVNVESGDGGADEMEQEAEPVKAPTMATKRDWGSDWTPSSLSGVVQSQIWLDYVNNRLHNPTVGMSKEHTLLISVETLLIVIQNHLWKGEARNIKVNGPGFSRRFGWNIYSQRVLSEIGFIWSEQGQGSRSNSPTRTDEGDKDKNKNRGVDTFLRSPPVNPSPPPGTDEVPASIAPSTSESSSVSAASSPSSLASLPAKKPKKEKPLIMLPEAMYNRQKLLRAWVEISAWLVEWKGRNARALVDLPNYSNHELFVKIDPAREMFQSKIGASWEQVPRGQLPDAIISQSFVIEDKLAELGLTTMSYNPELLAFAYLSQVRCHPTHTPTLFTSLSTIMKLLVSHNACPDIITKLYIAEDTRGRWTKDDVVRSVIQLGFSVDLERLWDEFGAGGTRLLTVGVMNDTPDVTGMDLNVETGLTTLLDDMGILTLISPESIQKERPYHEGFLKMDYFLSNDQLECAGGGEAEDAGGVPEDFVASAWRECIKREWQGEPILQGTGEKNGVKGFTDALRIVAQSRGSRTLMTMFDRVKYGENGDYTSGGGAVMGNPYDVFEIPKEIDDGMLITVYQMRVDEQPSQLEKMQQALYLIAEIRDSRRLKEFVRTARDPGDIVAPTRADWPRGLNQLGNTCYLNSLLQYFYTIKELRSSVTTTGGTISSKSLDFLDYKSSTATGKAKAIDNGDDDMKVSALTDDDLKRHRVGGRLVTRREIIRSKQFVSHLATLFQKLEYDNKPSVTPSIELAKLALVTSKDEEDDDASVGSNGSKGGAGSDDTDATLVEDGSGTVPSSLPSQPQPTPIGPSAIPLGAVSTSPVLQYQNFSSDSSSYPQSRNSPTSPTRSPSSVLGKRARVLAKEDTEIEMEHRSVSPPSSTLSIGSGSASVPASVGSASRASSKLPDVPEVSQERVHGESPSETYKDRVREVKEDAGVGAGQEDVLMRDASPLREMGSEKDRRKTPPPLPPRKSTIVQNDSVMMFGKQHDVAECMDNCMFQIETALLRFDGGDAGMEDTSDEPEKGSIVKRLFYGKISQTFIETLKGEPTKHQKQDLFSHLPVNVGADAEVEFGFDIYDGLGRYFDDTIEYEGQKVPMEVGLVKLPPLLQIQLQRVQFNRELLQSWKSQAYVKFGETLYMDRFMDNANPEKRKRSKAIQDELNSCRERLKLLTEGKANNTLFSQALEITSKYLLNEGSTLASLDIPISPPQVTSLSSEHDYLQAEIAYLRTRTPQLKAELEDMWKDDKSIEYELTSVFIHRGASASFGHYFFYSRNLPDKPDEWFKYNDEEVSEITKEEVFKDTTGETANPYLLVFARKDSQVVSTINRSVSDGGAAS